MMNRIFDLCVALLVWLAGVTGTTYKQINVIVFCILWPMLTLILVAAVVVQYLMIRRLRRAGTGGR